MKDYEIIVIIYLNRKRSSGLNIGSQILRGTLLLLPISNTTSTSTPTVVELSIDFVLFLTTHPTTQLGNKQKWVSRNQNETRKS